MPGAKRFISLQRIIPSRSASSKGMVGGKRSPITVSIQCWASRSCSGSRFPATCEWKFQIPFRLIESFKFRRTIQSQVAADPIRVVNVLQCGARSPFAPYFILSCSPETQLEWHADTGTSRYSPVGCGCRFGFNKWNRIGTFHFDLSPGLQPVSAEDCLLPYRRHSFSTPAVEQLYGIVCEWECSNVTYWAPGGFGAKVASHPKATNGGSFSNGTGNRFIAVAPNQMGSGKRPITTLHCAG